MNREKEAPTTPIATSTAVSKARGRIVITTATMINGSIPDKTDVIFLQVIGKGLPQHRRTTGLNKKLSSKQKGGL
jgi:hypothetical protein